MRLNRAFDGATKARILEAVLEAEAQSRGEIVPLVVERSATYPEARVRCGLVLAALTSAVAIYLGLPMPWLPVAQCGAVALGSLLVCWPTLARLFVTQKALEAGARGRAARAFLEEGLTRTQEGTGVLVFASLFERVAVVMGDHGIHGKMGADWEDATRALTTGLREGRPADGFVAAIRLCGDRLARHFPCGVSNQNELSDSLRERNE